ncbi:MAG: tetratricopeptide repeat protein [Planctomycetota bacterium]
MTDQIETPENVAAQEAPEASQAESNEQSAIELLRRIPTTIEDVDAIRQATFANPRTWERLDHFVREVMKEDEPDYEQKYAFGLAILGLYELAEPKLEALKDLPMAACLLGRIYLETKREAEAVQIFKQIHERVPEVSAYHFLYAGALEAAEDVDGFRRELEKLEATESGQPDTLYFQGIAAERNGEYEEAKSLFLKALEINPNHASSLFRLAFRVDLEGHDDEAMDYYKRCIESAPSNVAALTNMGVLYEDAERYEEATNCFQLVELIYPTDERARIYSRDAEASKVMYYDEEKEKKEDKQAQILRIPVTDFELSVRSRNCLSKMNIRTLGDLIAKTEAELLAFKNFGETSLQEIKGILSSKGLRLGMITPDTDELPKFLEPVKTTTSSNDSILNKPLEELDLSVRSRNCLTFLQIKTLGQLADTTEQQLLSCKNFGQTSLNEIRKKLTDYGLSLKV